MEQGTRILLPESEEEPASDTVHAISDAQASVAMNVPDWALKGWDYAAGKGTDFINNTFGTNFDNPHAKTWDEARDEDDYVIQWANEEAQKHDLSTPEGRENMRYEGSKLGHPGWTRSLMDYGRQNPDSWQARTANVLVPMENFWRRFIMKDAPVNAAFAATPLGIMTMLKNIYSDLSGKNVVIIGASLIVGRPLATLMLNQECTVTITHIHTRNIKELTRKADILIAACGVAKLVKQDWIKDGAVLIDVGINRENGRICGDIDADDVKEKAAFLTPVPGGVGPMTVAMLLQNTVDAYIMQHQ